MALTLTYNDAYLAPLIANNEAWETRALADVAELGTFPDPWPAKLAVLRAYLLCCIESLADETDVFSAKLKQYRQEWTASLQAARIAANAAASTPTRLFSVPIVRG
jgi:hypothetical protein